MVPPLESERAPIFTSCDHAACVLRQPWAGHAAIQSSSLRRADDHLLVPIVGRSTCRVLQMRVSGYALWLSCPGYPSAER